MWDVLFVVLAEAEAALHSYYVFSISVNITVRSVYWKMEIKMNVLENNSALMFCSQSSTLSEAYCDHDCF